MENVVYVIGAGASVELGLPSGERLKEKISGALKFFTNDFDKWDHSEADSHIVRTINESYAGRNGKPSVSDSYKAARTISMAMPLARSIDNFLHSHRNNSVIVDIGKIAITKCIIEAERDSSLFKLVDIQRHGGQSIDFSVLGKCWYLRFFQALFQQCTVDEIEQRLSFLTFVVFNYDRCFEYMLILALKCYFEIDIGRAAEIAEKAKIYHPYGIVGPVEWWDKGPSKFGSIPGGDSLLQSSYKIKTFTEGVTLNESHVSELQGRTYKARKIICLGFAFDPLNLEVLFKSSEHKQPHRGAFVYGTVFQRSPSDIASIQNALASLVANRDHQQFANVSCYEFFDTFSRKLSFV